MAVTIQTHRATLPTAFPTLDLDEARRHLEHVHPDEAILATALDGNASPIVQGVEFFREAAVMLFPAWLPEADGIDHPGGSGLSALRHVARKASRDTVGVNPVLEPLAVEALTRRRATLTDLADETIVRSCARLISRSYGGAALLLLLAIPHDRDNAAVSHAVSWLAGLAVGQVFICGQGARGVAHALIAEPDTAPATSVDTTGERRTAPYISPVPGRPSPNSPTEQRVERVLADAAWAGGRQWQAPWQADALTTPIRLDLIFPDARLIVEFDGLEHLAASAYASDRRRDRQLMAAGYRVIRFTNAEVAADLTRVADEIRAFVEERGG